MDGCQPVEEDPQGAPQRLDVELGRMLDLGLRHRFEDPVAERQPDPDRPAQRRAAVRGGDVGLDGDGDALGVAALDDELVRRFERLTTASKTPALPAARCVTVSRSPAAGDPSPVRATDTIPLAISQLGQPSTSAILAKTTSGGASIAVSIVTSIAISRPRRRARARRRSARAGTTARGPFARPASRSGGSDHR